MLHNLFLSLVNGLMTKVLFLIFAFASFSLGVDAQASTIVDDEDVQSWNDVQLNVPLSKKLDFFTKLTLRIGKDVSRLQDGRHSIGLAFKPISALTISPFYWFIRARNASGFFRPESRFNISATYRFPFKAFGLSHRSTYEHRLRTSGNSSRYRAMITFEKNLPKTVARDTKIFVSDEVFYDSVFSQFSRNRFSAGVARTISKHLGFDVYYTRQNDGFSHPGDLNILWTAVRIRP